ncbi:hypothetical protein ACC771_16075, partial [Rhizobium ruizarguesonis]
QLAHVLNGLDQSSDLVISIFTETGEDLHLTGEETFFVGRELDGWDNLREDTLAREKQLGVVPADTKLAPKPEAIKDWDKRPQL